MTIVSEEKKYIERVEMGQRKGRIGSCKKTHPKYLFLMERYKMAPVGEWTRLI